MGETRVHNVRFYAVEPGAIHCMAYEPDHRKLALSRADSSVEIWDVGGTAFLERVIPGEPQGSVEAIAWHGWRLFSTGINAKVVEYDLKVLAPKCAVPVTAGPAWCLHVHQKTKRLAVGTEDGFINIFSITSDNLHYETILDKQEGRILCLTWDDSGSFIVTGSADAVRIWNVSTGHALHKMTTGREENNKETIVWCVAVTNDFTIISGDSRGKICFWDGHKGLLKESYQSHAADVLCITLSEDQSKVFCAGVDPVIVIFERINIKPSAGQSGGMIPPHSKRILSERSQWCRSFNRKIHEHDVRSMSFCHGKLFSGGIDSYLTMSKEPKILVRYPPTSQSNLAALCPGSRCLLLRHSTSLEIWRLGSSESLSKLTSSNDIVNNNQRKLGKQHYVNGNITRKESTSSDHQKSYQVSKGPLPLMKNPVKLVELHSRGKEHIVCAALSSNARWLTYSTNSIVRVYSVHDLNEETPRLEKVPFLPEELSPAHRLELSLNGSLLVSASQKGHISSFRLNAEECSVTLEAILSAKSLTDTVHLLVISPDNRFIIAGDLSSNIVVWKDNQEYYSLPRHKCCPTALALNPVDNKIVIAYSDQKIVQSMLESRKYSLLSGVLDDVNVKSTSRPYPILNIAFDPRNHDVIILHDDSTIFVLRGTKLPPEKSPRMAKLPRRNTEATQVFTRIKKYKHLVFFGWLGGDEMVAVEVNPLHLLKQLPPVFAKKRFGT